MRLDSDPVTPLISGFRDFIHPNMWSKERFSWTKTTTVLMGELLVLLLDSETIFAGGGGNGGRSLFLWYWEFDSGTLEVLFCSRFVSDNGGIYIYICRGERERKDDDDQEGLVGLLDKYFYHPPTPQLFVTINFSSKF